MNDKIKFYLYIDQLIFGNLKAYPYTLGYDIFNGSLFVHHPLRMKPNLAKNLFKCLQVGPHF